MYGPNSMSKEGRRECFTRYKNKIASNEIFDFQKEMLTYCRSDVDILRRACPTFKDLLRGHANGQRSQRHRTRFVYHRLPLHGRFQNEISERRLVRAHPERRGVKMVEVKTT